ncbi:recombination regulator RecX [Parvibium lacunae]|uniref:Regulatory protein RecX n=1 Tax=Parvibium lacunae TaxID=1888893 RepID=A0A368L4N3_9BURK|nr:recombination regulator RecX [Parvibium lacunae]RCS58534.1 recombination regulator RecX [Parvibium lacunae]
MATLSLKARAVRLLARREYSQAELRQKLGPHAANPAELEQVLAALAAQQWQSDQRYVAQRSHTRAPRYGARRIAFELTQAGIAPALVQAELATLAQSEITRARQVWLKRFGQPPATPQEYQRHSLFLLRRGFTQDTVRRVLRTPAFDAGDES